MSDKVTDKVSGKGGDRDIRVAVVAVNQKILCLVQQGADKR